MNVECLAREERKSSGKLLLLKNAAIFVVGFAGFVTGTYYSLLNVVNYFRTWKWCWKWVTLCQVLILSVLQLYAARTIFISLTHLSCDQPHDPHLVVWSEAPLWNLWYFRSLNKFVIMRSEMCETKKSYLLYETKWPAGSMGVYSSRNISTLHKHRVKCDLNNRLQSHVIGE